MEKSKLVKCPSGNTLAVSIVGMTTDEAQDILRTNTSGKFEIRIKVFGSRTANINIAGEHA